MHRMETGLLLELEGTDLKKLSRQCMSPTGGLIWLSTNWNVLATFFNLAVGFNSLSRMLVQFDGYFVGVARHSRILASCWPFWVPNKFRSSSDCRCKSIWGFPSMGVPQNRWFRRENPIKMDDLTVPPILGKPLYGSGSTRFDKPSPMQLCHRWVEGCQGFFQDIRTTQGPRVRGSHMRHSQGMVPPCPVF